jgi:hypothetical protein
MSRKELVPSTFDVNQLPILMCRRTGIIEVETERCVLCNKVHIHGVSADMLDGAPSHRLAHCQVPPRGLKGPAVAAWRETVRKGYRIQLAK